MANYFDQFDDNSAAQPTANFFDQFDGGAQAPTKQPEKAPQETSILDDVGQGLAGAGRVIAGGVAGLANAGVGVVNAVGSANNWAENKLYEATGGAIGNNDPYKPLAPAGYGDWDQYLMPQNTAEKIGADVITYAAGGEIVAPLKAAETAGKAAKIGTALVNNAAASAVGSVSKYNQGDQAGDIAADMAVNAVAGTALEGVARVGINKARQLLPESLGGFSQAERAADVVNPDYVNRVLQGNDQDAQAAFRTATSDVDGNSILTPSQVFNTGKGKKFVAAEQRDLNRGSDSVYQERLDAQKSGEGLGRAIDDVEGETTLQDAAQDITGQFKQQSNALYNDAKSGAQDILDGANITKLKFSDTRAAAKAHLDDNAAVGGVKLTPEARKTLTQFNKADIKNIDDLDEWKRTLSEKAQKAYRAGDHTSSQALRETLNSLKGEADRVISSINPDAGSLYRTADQYYAQSVGDFGSGKRSILGKISDVANPDLAGNTLLRGQNAEFNTDQVVTALKDAIDRGDLEGAQALSAQLAGGIGDTSRRMAYDAATTGENFSPTKFVNSLNRTEPQAAAATDLAGYAGATRDESAINNALADAIRAQRERATVATPLNGVASQIVGRGVGGTIGAGIGGTPGAVIGQEVGGRVSSAIQSGFVDRLMGTTTKADKYISYLSDPANASRVQGILEARGSSFSDAGVSEVKSIVDSLASFGKTAAVQTYRNQPEKEKPAAQPVQANTQTAPEPEQRAQSVKAPTSDKLDPRATKLYKAIATAETGGLDNRYIRTKAAEAGTSTAYGPAQITVSKAKTFMSKHGKDLSPELKEYGKRFISQGNAMLHADKNDPVFGYGAPGVLTSKEDQVMYAHFAIKMLEQDIEDNGGKLDPTVLHWRGANDGKYFKKVRNAWSVAQ